jgi:polyferredoxin
VNVLHDRNPQFVTLSDGSIRNGYTVKLLNMIPEPRTFVLSIDDLPGATISVVGVDKQLDQSVEIAVEPDRLKTLKVFVRQPQELIAGPAARFHFLVQTRSGHERAHYDATFNAPEASR